MHAVSLIWMLASMALASEHLRPLLRRQEAQPCSALGYQDCGSGCIDPLSTCCPDGSGGCPDSTTCQIGANGAYLCCPLLESCIGNGGALTSTITGPLFPSIPPISISPISLSPVPTFVLTSVPPMTSETATTSTFSTAGALSNPSEASTPTTSSTTSEVTSALSAPTTAKPTTTNTLSHVIPTTVATGNHGSAPGPPLGGVLVAILAWAAIVA